MWMADEALAAAFDMQGAFNDVALSLSAQAREREVVAALDELLRRYGGLSAYGRDEQLSHRFLTDELGELEVMTTTIPSLFLAVSAFLLYVVLSRLVATQRTQIGLLKAFGRTDARVGLHYLYLALATVAIGLALGLPLGIVLGGMFVDLYRDFFHFPRLAFAVDPALLLLAAGVSVVAGGVGALVAVRRAVALAPAEAMRPEPPATFRAGALSRSGWARRLPASLRMIVRNLVRKPWKALASVLGMAFAIGLMVVGRFAVDAPSYMLSVQVNEVQRDDVTVLYNEPRGPARRIAIAKMDGVVQAEPFRRLPAWLRHEHRSKRIEVTGLVPGHELRRLLDGRLRPVELPPQGLVLTEKLARILGLAPGDMVTMEVLEGARPVLQVPVVGLVDEMLGLGAYMDARALARLLGEDRTSSGAYLRIQADAAPGFYARLKRMPVVAGVTARSAVAEEPARDPGPGVLLLQRDLGGVLVRDHCRHGLQQRAHLPCRSGATSWRACPCSASPSARWASCCSASRRCCCWPRFPSDWLSATGCAPCSCRRSTAICSGCPWWSRNGPTSTPSWPR